MWLGASAGSLAKLDMENSSLMHLFRRLHPAEVSIGSGLGWLYIKEERIFPMLMFLLAIIVRRGTARSNMSSNTHKLC